MKNTVEIPTSELKIAVSGLGKVVSKRSTLPVLQSIKVARDNMGIVSLHGTDLDSFATYKLPIAQDGDPVEFLVPIDTLARTAKGTKDRVALYPEGKDAVIIQTFISNTPLEQKVQSGDPKEWPQAPSVISRSVLLEETFRTTMKEAWECASEDECRFVLNSVYLDARDPKAHYMVSTDGRALYSANSFSFSLKDSLMIPTRKFLAWNGWWTEGSALLNIKPRVPAVKPGEVDQPGWLQFSTDQWTFTTKQIDGDYPNWKQVIPETPPNTVLRLTEKAVSAMLELIARLPGSEESNHPITLNIAHKQLFLEGRSKDQGQPASVPVPDVTVEGAPLKVCLNRDYLKKALRFGLQEIHLIDGVSPLIAKSGGKKMIIMPARLDCGNPVATPANTSTPGQAQPAPETPDTETQPIQPPAEPQNSPAVTTTTTINPTHERKTMPKTAITTEVEIKPEIPDSPLKAAMAQIEMIKDTLRSIIHQMTDVLGALRTAEREKRATEREIEAVREKLREIQSVKI